ncbi:MAG: SGNH/GDSL hydrolase family protein, partial [Chitinophagaceae bacterium]
DNPKIQYVGRIDFSHRSLPRLWCPGVYIRARFKGSYCAFLINDQVLNGTYHNYLEYVVDDHSPVRVQTTGKKNLIIAAQGLSSGPHTITICKNTESGIGYLEFVGFRCQQLLHPLPLPKRKLECIGNSITCGFGSDQSVVPCGKGQWYDQHNAYMSYGARTARMLQAQYHLTAVSGIGLIHSCCQMSILMPEVFDKIDPARDSLTWDFNLYQPNVVTICLGQNDGVQDSTAFCSSYVSFIDALRSHYPHATIICLNSPMANATLNPVLKNYLTSIVRAENASGDKKVHQFFFDKRYNHGCGNHPDMQEHQLMAVALSGYIKKVMHW